MKAAELVARVIALGADGNEIADRFDGNNELYRLCFRDFLEEPNFSMLNEAIRERDYDRAFGCAHALKGIAGNLALRDAYRAICVLVDLLRAKKYSEVERQYGEVRRQMEKLRGLLGESADGNG